MFSRLAIPFSLLVLVAIAMTRSTAGDDRAINAYHERVARVIESIPIAVNGWVGEPVPIPQSATSLLRPNALIARRYYNAEKNIYATLMIVQCKDTRDMAGHYPPRCYPANGWMESDEHPSGMYTRSEQPVYGYVFDRTTGQDEREITVYNLFALPSGELTTSMSDVRKLGADYVYRRYGAAQLQVLIDGTVGREEHPWVLDELYRIAKPSIEAVLHSDQDDGKTEGSQS